MKKVLHNLLIFLFIIALLSPIGCFAKTKSKKPSDRAILHNNKGVTALYKNDIDTALFELKTATELSPEYVEAWNNLGLAYKFAGKLEMAEQALKTAIALDKKYASPYNHLGIIYYQWGRYDEALDQFEKANKLNKKFSDALYNMGLTYKALYKKKGGKEYLTKAIEVLTKATKYNSEHSLAHNELAKIYQEQGD